MLRLNNPSSHGFAAALMTHISPQCPLIYLASASPRRQELLAQVGLSFVTLPQQIDESHHINEDPGHYVLRLAREKLEAALHDKAYVLPMPVLAADTTVVFQGQILGKPANLAEAILMLKLLSGSQHQVLTGVAIAQAGKIVQRLVSTTVFFRPLEESEIIAYWESGEPCDKAGAYAIQGLGALFVSRIEGSYSNVVGLPLFETLQILTEFGINSTKLLAGAAV